MRGFAVVGVMWSHTYSSRFSTASAGVDVFFVLSGFLITFLLLLEHDRSGHVDLRAFYLRRARRLLPALTLMLPFLVAPLILLKALAVYRGPTLSELPWTILYVGNWNTGDIRGTDLLAHTWSLGVEEQFYIVWPLVCLLVLTRNWNRTRVASVLFGSAVAEMIGRYWYLGPHHGSIYWSYSATMFRCDGLLLGCALAFVYAAPGGRWLQSRGLWVALGAASIAALGVLAFVLIAPYDWIYNQWAYIPLVILPTLIILANTVVRPLRPLNAVLKSRPAVWVGRRSYGIYVYNFPIFRLFALLGRQHGSAHLGILVAEFAANLMAADLSWRYLERPILDRYAARRGRAVARPTTLGASS